MNSSIAKVFIFAAGAAIGSAVTWKITKTKYEKIANEEIASVKEVYSKKAKVVKESEEPEEDALEFCEEEKNEAKTIIKTNNYITYSNARTKEGETMCEDMYLAPYVIPPEEFGEETDYDTESLTYYKDGTVTDDFDNPIDREEWEDMIGENALNHFGQYEDDSVFVRNDERQTYYEILRDDRDFSEVIGG